MIKHQHKSNWYLFLISFFILCVGGVLFFILLDQVISFDIDNKLHRRKNYTIKKLAESDSIVQYQNYSANMLYVQETSPFSIEEEEIETISDTTIFDDIELRDISFRKLIFKKKARNKFYLIEIRRSLLEKREVLGGVVALVLLIIIIFSSILSFLNYKLSKNTWAPFHTILENIKNYNINNTSKLHFPKSSVEEFDSLSSEITSLTHKIQKEFLENTSHEMKTPLAIINNKLELLLQSGNLSPEQLESVNSSLKAANRLAKLNESLLLLARIQNKQFHGAKTINLNKIIAQHLLDLEELIDLSKITVTTDFSNEIRIEANPFLVDMLIENLISNAIRHNKPEGKILISLSDKTLRVSNTGEEPAVNPTLLFERFSKASGKTNSLGLGLSIVKSICETYNYQATYTYENNRHVIQIVF